jgi:hypothetical protein
MSERLTQRIQAAATKLQLLHLSDAVDTLVARAQEGQVGYREFLDLVLEEDWASARAAASNRRSNWRGCPIIKPSMTSTSPSSRTSMWSG